MKKKKEIAILGSTGSIGRQALQVIEEHKDLYEVYCLTADKSVDLLAKQAHKYNPSAVVVASKEYYDALKTLMIDRPDIKVYAGKEALDDIVQADSVDVVLAAIVGFAGLSPTLHAIKARKTICLANKETLVVAGELVRRLASQYHIPILPVDSEHSAIFQCLAGEGENRIEKIYLTASGGPFRNFNSEQLAYVTVKDALQHPTWDMGAKITIDSATMMNKGFEVMEAKWLFGIEAERIEVLVHPQSVIHSAVEFIDGAIKAQLAVPDMRLPIQYSLSYPERLPLSIEHINLFAEPLEFYPPDINTFRCLPLAFEALRRGGNAPCIVNAANEVVNLGFRKGKCNFLDISDIIEKTMTLTTFDNNPSYSTYVETDIEARRIALELMNK